MYHAAYHQQNRQEKYLMNPEELEKMAATIAELVSHHKSLREFAKIIKQDSSDVTKWKQGVLKVNPRAVIMIARLFGLEPHLLRPDIFDEDVHLTFDKPVKTKR